MATYTRLIKAFSTSLSTLLNFTYTYDYDPASMILEDGIVQNGIVEGYRTP